MARNTQDREDLLRDGVAMVQRGRLTLAGKEVVVGFRREGQLSLYWDQDPVFQFDTNRELRRVFWRGRRMKAEAGRLVDLTPARSPQDLAVRHLQLQSQPLPLSDQATILCDLESKLQQIQTALHSETVIRSGASLHTNTEQNLQADWVTVGVEPDQFAARVVHWIAEQPFPIPIANDARASQ